MVRALGHMWPEAAIYVPTVMLFTVPGCKNCVLLFSGIFKHSQELSKAYLADLTPVNEHAKVFGQFNSVSSIGFVFGPIIGGHLADSTNGFYLVSFFTGAIFLLNTCKIQLFFAITREIWNDGSIYENAGNMSVLIEIFRHVATEIKPNSFGQTDHYLQ